MDELISTYDLFIFDLDDTIVMTEIYHNKAWNIAISKELNKDYNLDFKEYCSIFHSNKKDYFKNYLNEMLNINNFLDICFKKNKIFLEYFLEYCASFRFLAKIFLQILYSYF